jgi:hypothetical protein
MKITRDEIKQLVEQEVEKRSGDVTRVSKKLDTFSTQLEPLLGRINTRVEFEQFLKDAIKLSSKNVKGPDIIAAMRKVYQQLQKEVK